MRVITRSPLAVALLLLACSTAAAARGQPGDRVRLFLVLRLTEALHLPDEKALEVSRIVRQAGERRRALENERRELAERLRVALDRSPVDEDELHRLVSEANENDKEMALVGYETFQEIQKILTLDQQARLVLLGPQLRHEVREALEKRLRRRLLRRRGGLPHGAE